MDYANAKITQLVQKMAGIKYYNTSFFFTGYDNKDCPGQVTYSVGQLKISVACPTGQVVISFLKFFIDSIVFQFKH